jgi:putative endonuclease
MSKHSKIGIKGEQIAEYFLQKKGYIIMHRNWRAGKREIDLIAGHDGVIVIVEVKTRSGAGIAFPEEAVTVKKQQHLKLAAAAFADANPQYRDIRFDIVSIILNGDAIKEIVHFEEAFH